MSKRADNSARADRDAYFEHKRRQGPQPPLECAVGDEVAYTRYFLKCIGLPATDPDWSARGRVTETPVMGDFARVDWGDGEGQKLVNRCNLAKPGPNLRFCE